MCFENFQLIQYNSFVTRGKLGDNGHWLIEVEAVSPEAYVKENGRCPIIDITVNNDGDTVITTGDGSGNLVKYTFSE